MSRRRSRQPPLADLFGEVVAEGWGLPLIAFLISAVVSYTGAQSLVAHVPEGQEWRYPAAALVFLAQWAGNVCLLRARMNTGPDRANFLRAWLMCAVVAAGGLTHAVFEVRAADYARTVDARADARLPLTHRLDEANAAVERAQKALADVLVVASAEHWPRVRIAAASAPQEAILNGPPGHTELGALARAGAAQAALNGLPALTPTRTPDWFDLLALLVGALIAGLERVFYWSMLTSAERREGKLVPAPKRAQAPEPEVETPGGVLINLAQRRISRAVAAAAAGAALAMGSAAAADTGRPLAGHGQGMVGQGLTDGRPDNPVAEISPQDQAAGLLIQRVPRRQVMAETGLKRWEVDAIAASLGLVRAVSGID